MSIRAAQLPYRQQTKAGTVGSVVWRGDQPVTSATYIITLDNAQLGSGTATVAAVDGGVHVSCSVPSGLDIDCGYECRLTLTGADYSEALVLFDVVRSPLGPLVSLDDITAIRPGETRYIQQAADLLGLTADLFAESLAGRARAALDDMLRDRVIRLRDELGASAERPGDTRYRDLEYLRARAILDVDRLTRIERYLAVAELYATKMRGASADGGEDPDATLHSHYVSEAKAAFKSMGQVRLDLDDDGTEDARGSGFDGVVHYIRRQA